MSNQKPVWRMNSGAGVPSDLGGFVLYEGAAKSEKVQGYHFNHNDKWLIKNYMDIAAYQTTRTKAARYERVECAYCCGTGHDGWLDTAVDKFIEYIDICQHCNGKGYTLEKIK